LTARSNPFAKPLTKLVKETKIRNELNASPVTLLPTTFGSSFRRWHRAAIPQAKPPSAAAITAKARTTFIECATPSRAPKHAQSRNRPPGSQTLKRASRGAADDVDSACGLEMFMPLSHAYRRGHAGECIGLRRGDWPGRSRQ